MTVEILRPQDVEAASPASVVASIVAALLMAAGAWFGYLGWTLDSYACSVTAVLLLFGAPALALAAILARNPADAPDEHTSAFALMERLQRLDLSLRAVQLARAHVYVGASYAVVLGVCQATRLIDSREFVLFYAAAMLVAAAAYLPWCQRQERHLHSQRALHRRLMGDRKAGRVLRIE